MEYKIQAKRKNENYYALLLFPIVTLTHFRKGENSSLLINITFFTLIVLFCLGIIFDLVGPKKTILIRLTPDGILIDDLQYEINRIIKVTVASNNIRFSIKDKKFPLSFLVNGDKGKLEEVNNLLNVYCKEHDKEFKIWY